jgi:hypothetical protein
MHFDFIPQINKDIARTKRAIIGIGCSFVEGHGAVAQPLWDKYHTIDVHDCYDWKVSDEDKKIILQEYPDIFTNTSDNKLNFYRHEHNNSFVSVLCKKYFNGEYAAINLGRRGNGNRAAIKDLYYYPDINWDQLEEIIVIYCPTGAERFDFIDDRYHQLNCHGRWISMWPNSYDKGQPVTGLWEGYRDSLYSQKFMILEAIANVQELLTWCKYKKAKLIITPAFMRYYTKKDFIRLAKVNIERDCSQRLISERGAHEVPDEEFIGVIEMWPWENMFYPEGYPSFADLVLAQEKSTDWEHGPGFYSWLKHGTPDKWITPCGHPSVKGHDLFASILYKHITENL